jgi:hypothetical protein
MKAKRNAIPFLGLILAAFGCSGGGGGSGGGSGSTALAPIASYAPTAVARAASYSWTQVLAPGAGTISALGVAPSSTSLFAALVPTNVIERIDPTGNVITEATLPDVPGSFASDGTDLLVGTSGSVAGSGGSYRRDPASGAWSPDLQGTLTNCVLVSFNGTTYGLQGEPGSQGIVSQLAGSWQNVASLGSCVPASAVSFNGAIWVGGQSSVGAGAQLLDGVSSFTPVNVPVSVGQGQQASVTALGVLNGALFAGVSVLDDKTGATVAGGVYYVAANGPVSLLPLQGEGAVAFAALDGTIYVATSGGRILWLDANGRFEQDAPLPANQGVTAMTVYMGTLAVAINTANGPVLLERQVVNVAPPASTTPPSSTPPPSGGTTPPPSGGTTPPPTGGTTPPKSNTTMTFSCSTPSSGYTTGYWSVLITGSNFIGLTSVTIGGQPVMDLSYSPVEISCRVPAIATPGTQTLQIVSSSQGTLVVPNAIGYLAVVATAPSYATDILPIITANCVVCHNTPSLVTLTPYATVMNDTVGGEGLVNPGSVDMTSYILTKLDTTIGGTMATMSSHVTPAQLTTIENWIAGGARP